MAQGKQLTRWFGGDRTLRQQMMGLDPLFAQVEGKTVLDVGCAEGLLSIECVKSGAEFVLGAEIRQDAVDEAQRLRAGLNVIERSKVQFTQADANVWAPDNIDSDIVLMLAVLHKLKNPTEACARLAAAARDLVVIRMPPAHAPTIVDDRSGNQPHHIGKTMELAGFTLEHSSNDGPFGEWVGYWRRNRA